MLAFPKLKAQLSSLVANVNAMLTLLYGREVFLPCDVIPGLEGDPSEVACCPDTQPHPSVTDTSDGSNDITTGLSCDEAIMVEAVLLIDLFIFQCSLL